MNQGILEGIDAKLNRILELMGQATVTAAPAVTAATAGVSEQGNAVETATPAADAALAATGTAVEVDSAGMPWDERIHAKSKTKKADGTWKAGRSLDPEMVKQVEAELKAAQSGVNVATTGSVFGAADTPAANLPVVPGQAAANLPAVPGQAAANLPAVPGQVVTIDYKQKAITAINNITSRGVPFTAFNDVFARFGCQNLNDLPVDQYEAFFNRVDNWDCDLNDAADIIEQLTAFGDQATQGVAQLVSGYGATAFHLIHNEHLAAFIGNLREYLANWQRVVAGQ